MLKSHLGNGHHDGGVAACAAGPTSTPALDAGSRTANSVRPGTDVTLTFPPWASTIDCTIESPSPLVPSAEAVALAAGEGGGADGGRGGRSGSGCRTAAGVVTGTGFFREASARVKRAKTRPTNSGAIPGPLSVTVTTALPSGVRRTPVTTVVPGPVCLRALESKWASNWLSWVA